MEQYNIKSKTNYRQALEKIHINTKLKQTNKKQTNKWSDDDEDDNNNNNSFSILYKMITEQELGDQNFQNGRAEFKTKVDLSKKECIEAMLPHT
jgi:hypothetical protein